MEGLMNFISSSEYIFGEFNLFTLIIISLIILTGVFTYLTRREKDVITMIGIFGTFSGIIAGLYFFDEKDIDGSIPKLIGGLKTAFYTSIVGLGITILLNFFEKNDDNKDEIDFLKDIKDEIIKSNNNNKESNELIVEKLVELNKGISGDGSYTLITQVRELKEQNNKDLRNLKKSFDDFAEKMSDNNIDALTEAIEKVMGEFNTIINEKLGKTFDDFKKSVENLNIWQENYKENIVSSKEALNLSKDSLERTSKGFEITLERSEAFSGVSEKLGDELKSLNSSLEIFKNGINEFDGVAKNTKEMANSMTESINSLTESFISKAEKMVGESEKQITFMKETFSEQSKDLKESHKNILDDLQKELLNNSKHSSEEFIRMQGKLEEQVLRFDEKLGEELEKSLKTMGEQLTGLSGKFVSDYGKLAEKLERLVSLSNK